MATKQVQISPIAARLAGCTATCESYAHDDFPDGGWAEYYQATATPANGWRFVRFDWTLNIETPSGTSPDALTNTSNPLPNTADKQQSATLGVWDFLTLGSHGQFVQRGTMSDWVAVFEQVAPHVPTHLPVDSSNLAAPVQIVHDGKTNLPVADF